jgi:hypothetical protein
MAPHAVILYIALPSLAAGIAGYIWGGAILDPCRVQTNIRSILRGFMIGAGAFLIFSVLYACLLPMLEGQWSWRRTGSLFLLTLMFGIVTGGPLTALTGMIAGGTLSKFGRHYFAESNRR